MPDFFDTSIEYLKGVGPQRANLLKTELDIHTFGELLQYYPYRYEDRTRFYQINEINPDLPYIQIKGVLTQLQQAGYGNKKRLVARLKDETGSIELVWFKGVQWILKKLKPGVEYVVFGKPNQYGRKVNIAHPEIEVLTPQNNEISYLQPVYSTTEKLRRKFLDSKAIAKLQKTLLERSISKIEETLPPYLSNNYNLISRKHALLNIHFPANQDMLSKASFRLKFEELFFIQLSLLLSRANRKDTHKGKTFNSAKLVTAFYEKHIPFELTQAQKLVIKEIYKDMRSGKQMNRLLQGDVGSGKTIVAFLSMLLAIDGGAQAAMMAPTEILALQHYQGLSGFSQKLGLHMALLTGSTKNSEKKLIYNYLKSGEIDIVVGTHALIAEGKSTDSALFDEEQDDRVQKVKFNNLGLAVIDEQHRFGVAQRSKLWSKGTDIYPHVLVMTATPIPRTLAMALYGDLDISVIDELPAGRKPVKTVHRYDSNRLKVWGFVKQQIEKGRQVYMVYPLIEESEKSDFKDLMDGYESVCRAFPQHPVSIVHGKMKSEDKDYEMQRFKKGETKIMVATTVIEVGVDISNATVMIIESAERFGLSQLHQLRGRVGRGAKQSYCILITKYKLSKEARLRIETMVRTNDGFEIADVDLQLRGPGNLMGTQQSGLLDLTIADLGKDGKILQLAREAATEIINNDESLETSRNKILKNVLSNESKGSFSWAQVS